MDKAIIIALLEKYWQAETSVEEERELAKYFRAADVDPELRAYTDLFGYFDEEAAVSAGPGFDDRILQRLGFSAQAGVRGAAEAAAISDSSAPAGSPAPVVRMAWKPFGRGIAAAAAAIVLVVAGLSLLQPARESGMTSAGGSAMTSASGSAMTPAGGSASRIAMTDTYDDPAQALAAVRHALLIASHHLNQGRHELMGSRK